MGHEDGKGVRSRLLNHQSDMFLYALSVSQIRRRGEEKKGMPIRRGLVGGDMSEESLSAHASQIRKSNFYKQYK